MQTPKIGLVGGLGPLSTIDYYIGLIERYHKDFGLEDYPEIVIDSINMKDFLDAMANEDVDSIRKRMHASIDCLKSSGATFAGICSNTPHLYQRQIFEGASLEMISIVDVTLQYIKKNNFKKVLILGTPFTMGRGLYDKRMPLYGIEPVVPNEKDRKEIGSIIFPNLENGIIIPEDKVRFIGIIERYIKEFSIDAVLLGCTELPLIIKNGDISVPAINTTEIHIDALYEKYVASLKNKMPNSGILEA